MITNNNNLAKPFFVKYNTIQVSFLKANFRYKRVLVTLFAAMLFIFTDIDTRVTPFFLLFFLVEHTFYSEYGDSHLNGYSHNYYIIIIIIIMMIRKIII